MATTIERMKATDSSRVLAAAPLFDRLIKAEAVERYLADGRNIVLIAYMDGEPVGMARATILSQVQTTQDQLFLYELTVAPASRRKGIGASLVTAMSKVAEGLGCIDMFLLARKSNEAAVRLYRRTGGVIETHDDQVVLYYFEKRKK